MKRHIFHLSIPVTDLSASKQFYIDVLRAKVGRETEEWADVLLWGHQITLQLRPKEVLSLPEQGKRHFGVTLPWNEWENHVQHVRALGAKFLAEPTVLLSGTPEEQAKFYLADPGNNVIEVKTYKNVYATLGLDEARL